MTGTHAPSNRAKGGRLAIVSAAAMMAICVAGCSKSTSSSGGGGDNDGTPVSVKLTSAGCDASRLSAPAGKVTFHVTGGGSGAVTELEVQKNGRILSERENIAPGFAGQFSVSLDPGSYSLYCPGGSGPSTHDFTVTTAGSAAASGTP